MTSERHEPKVSVVIVSYDTRDFLRRAVASVEDSYEVVVVDNASTDGSAEMIQTEFPSVKLIANAENVGFGPANNQGIDAAGAPLVLLMNSDAEAEPGAVEKLAEVFDDPQVVAAGGRLAHLDGRLQESAAGSLTLWAVFCEQAYLEKLFPRSRVFSPYWRSARLTSQSERRTVPWATCWPWLFGKRRPNLTEAAEPDARRRRSVALPGPFPVAQVMGACLMMRPIERFDERFFLYCEDTELCRRLAEHGRILFVPAARFIHALGASSQARWQAVARYNRGKELYFRIHFGCAASCVCFVLDRLGALLRLIGWSLVWCVPRVSRRPLTPTPLSKPDSPPASPWLDPPLTHGEGERRRAPAADKVALFWRVLTAPVSGPPRPPRTSE